MDRLKYERKTVKVLEENTGRSHNLGIGSEILKWARKTVTIKMKG